MDPVIAIWLARIKSLEKKVEKILKVCTEPLIPYMYLCVNHQVFNAWSNRQNQQI